MLGSIDRKATGGDSYDPAASGTEKIPGQGSAQRPLYAGNHVFFTNATETHHFLYKPGLRKWFFTR